MTSASYLVAARRTPVGKLLGALSTVPAPQLAAIAIRAALSDAGLAPDEVDEVILGQVLTAGVGQAPARQAALAGGLPPQVGAITINKVCGSGLAAVMLADRTLRAGDAQVVVAGGMENMSLAPYLLQGVRSGWKFGHQTLRDAMLHDGLWCAQEQAGMGSLADATARNQAVAREDQDAWALESHRRAVAAWQAGSFAGEVAPVRVVQGGRETLVSQDEGPRADCSQEQLARLKPAFGPDGTATAGNASQISDGAAAVVVVSEAIARRLRTPWRFRIVASATFAGPPAELFLAPIGAVRAVLQRAGLGIDEIDLVEINEAFASQLLACQRALEIDPRRLNVHGGAIALGHPIGASGARILTTLLHALVQRQARRGLATLCLGGGEAVAMVVERDG
jgi:acetyl-CoA C-acetyltransferase